MKKTLFGLLILWAVISLIGCSVEKRAQRKVAWLLSKDLMDDNCARLYPNVDSISKGDSVMVFDTLYLENEGQVLHDTIIQKGDSVLKIVDKKCPKTQVINQRTFIHDTLYRSNTAEITRLKNELSEKDKQLKEKDDVVLKQQTKIDKNDWWKTACLITWFVIVLGIITRLFIYKKPI